MPDGSDAVSLIGEMPAGIEVPADAAEIIVLLVLADAVSRGALRDAGSMMFFGSKSFNSRELMIEILPEIWKRFGPRCGKKMRKNKNKCRRLKCSEIKDNLCAFYSRSMLSD